MTTGVSVMTVKIGDNNDNNLQGSQDVDWLLGKGGKDVLMA